MFMYQITSSFGPDAKFYFAGYPGRAALEDTTHSV
jgi:hypothetical protein